MRTHQKYFSCLNPDGTPAPRFLFVANNVTAGRRQDHRRRQRARPARPPLRRPVLLGPGPQGAPRRPRRGAQAARLPRKARQRLRQGRADGDALAPIDLRRNMCPDADRGLRCGRSAPRVSPRPICRPAWSASSPNCRASWGAITRSHDGEDPRVADAIAEHYKPLGPDDRCPTAPVSIVVALADKIDTLVGFFAIGEKPTGSRTPSRCAAPRWASSALILENKLRLSLSQTILLRSTQLVPKIGYDWRAARRDNVARLLRRPAEGPSARAGRAPRSDRRGFFERWSTRTIWSACSRGSRALTKFLETEDGANLLTAYRRAVEHRRDRGAEGRARATTARPIRRSG